jgi:CBS domain-containing protein
MRPITAADLMNPQVLAVRDDMTVRALAAFLVDHEVSGAPVENGDGRLVGVVSVVEIAEAVVERGDLAAPGAEGANGAETAETPENDDEDDLSLLPLTDDELLVRDIMTPAVHSVTEDATVSEIASRMLDSHVHRLLVTSESRPVGIITTSDLLGLLIDE